MHTNRGWHKHTAWFLEVTVSNGMKRRDLACFDWSGLRLSVTECWPADEVILARSFLCPLRWMTHEDEREVHFDSNEQNTGRQESQWLRWKSSTEIFPGDSGRESILNWTGWSWSETNQDLRGEIQHRLVTWQVIMHQGIDRVYPQGGVCCQAAHDTIITRASGWSQSLVSPGDYDVSLLQSSKMSCVFLLPDHSSQSQPTRPTANNVGLEIWPWLSNADRPVSWVVDRYSMVRVFFSLGQSEWTHDLIWSILAMNYWQLWRWEIHGSWSQKSSMIEWSYRLGPVIFSCFGVYRSVDVSFIQSFVLLICSILLEIRRM